MRTVAATVDHDPLSCAAKAFPLGTERRKTYDAENGTLITIYTTKNQRKSLGRVANPSLESVHAAIIIIVVLVCSTYLLSLVLFRCSFSSHFSGLLRFTSLFFQLSFSECFLFAHGGASIM